MYKKRYNVYENDVYFTVNRFVNMSFYPFVYFIVEIKCILSRYSLHKTVNNHQLPISLTSEPVSQGSDFLASRHQWWQNTLQKFISTGHFLAYNVTCSSGQSVITLSCQAVGPRLWITSSSGGLQLSAGREGPFLKKSSEILINGLPTKPSTALGPGVHIILRNQENSGMKILHI